MQSTHAMQSIERRTRRRCQAKKREQLGLSIGTASYRLKKLVVFRLVQETGRDFCFRCKLRIISPSDLVFDHKVPWIDNSADLFWDLDNIAFSHADCNLRAVRRGRAAGIMESPCRKVAPPGMAWCASHEGFVPLANFRKNRSHWNGLGFECRVCESRRQRQHARGRPSRCPYWAGRLL